MAASTGVGAAGVGERNTDERHHTGCPETNAARAGMHTAASRAKDPRNVLACQGPGRDLKADVSRSKDGKTTNFTHAKGTIGENRRGRRARIRARANEKPSTREHERSAKMRQESCAGDRGWITATAREQMVKQVRGAM